MDQFEIDTCKQYIDLCDLNIEYGNDDEIKEYIEKKIDTCAELARLLSKK